MNLGNPREYTINEIAQIVRRLAGLWLSFICLACDNLGCKIVNGGDGFSAAG